MEHRQHWIVIADGRGASLWGCHRISDGTLHVERLKSLGNAHEDEHQHGRPILSGGAERRGSVARSGARAAPHVVSGGHTHEEEQRRFAREVSSWLVDARRNLKGRVTVFAPARFLGFLRAELVKEDHTDLREGELTNLRPHELAAHPAIVSAVWGSSGELQGGSS
jgi:hypothetical protein